MSWPASSATTPREVNHQYTLPIESTDPHSLQNDENNPSTDLFLSVSSATLLQQRQNLLVNAQSKRQRLWGLARATRDIYMPKLASVALIASSATSRSPQVEFDDYGLPLTFPNGTVVTLFPSFTRQVSAADSTLNQDGYLVSLRGWMWCPGLMSRKNRLVLSLAKQLTKGGGSVSDDFSQRAIEKLSRDSASLLDVDGSDTDSLGSASVADSTHSDPSGIDKLIHNRLSSFIATSIAKASLKAVVGAEDVALTNELVETQLYTDAKGHFEKEIFVTYKPSIFQVRASADSSIYAFQEVIIAPLAGFGIISDIDDTVKHTGVIGDKRELMNRLLTGHLSTWNIPEVVRWYQEMLDMSSATFHYVSNSPWQLFSVIHQYFESVLLPPGSIHLKQYSGNIIASLREPSTARKRKTLTRILEDFPQKQFLCVGDSGEHDFEAYVELAKSKPNQVLAIYIRVVPGSFSLYNDREILKKLKWMTAEWKKRRAAKREHGFELAIKDRLDFDLEVVSRTAISRSQKLPPLVPKKPASLKGQTIQSPASVPERQIQNFSNLPAQKDRQTSRAGTYQTRSKSPEWAPTPPPRRQPPLQQVQNGPSSGFDNLNTLYGVNDAFELENVDEKGALWLQKLNLALHELDDTDTDVAFFEDQDEEFFRSSLAELKSRVENL